MPEISRSYVLIVLFRAGIIENKSNRYSNIYGPIPKRYFSH
jgi:hypothetical protein